MDTADQPVCYSTVPVGDRTIKGTIMSQRLAQRPGLLANGIALVILRYETRRAVDPLDLTPKLRLELVDRRFGGKIGESCGQIA